MHKSASWVDPWIGFKEIGLTLDLNKVHKTLNTKTW